MNPTGSGSNFTKKNKKKKKIKKKQENNKKSACTCKTLRGARMEMTYPFKIRFVILKYRNNQVNDCFLELCWKLCSVFLFALQHVHHEKQGREKKIAPILSRPRHFVLVLPKPFISQGLVQTKLSMARTSFCFATTTHIAGNGMERTVYGPVFTGFHSKFAR